MRGEQKELYCIASIAKTLQLLHSLIVSNTLSHSVLSHTVQIHMPQLYLHFTIFLSASFLSSLTKGMTRPTTYLYEHSVDRQNLQIVLRCSGDNPILRENCKIMSFMFNTSM